MGRRGSTDTIFMRHSQHGGICWEQCESPEPAAKEKPNRYKVGCPSAFDPVKFQAVLTEFGNEVTRANVSTLADKMAVTEHTIWRWWKSFKTNESRNC
jgi:hypothetical protein